ncbi:MAG: integrase core domain-containing protein [Brevibacterium aurantiacum]|uniref:integrase core domain-containing protein n=1 Tax=Brevibacterium aurantiacum TaxID=273384 RepID=UPI003F9DAD6C
MSKSLSSALRRQIISYDPADPASPSISEFCRTHGISRPSFYKVRDRYAAEGNAALNPRSRAPKKPARTFTTDTANIVLDVRERVSSSGWDAGPKTIWFTVVDEALFADECIPSVSTIARILKDAGVVAKNPKKRPRTSYIRFQRAAAMELWQLDAFEFRLFDHDDTALRTKVTIYQLIDDSTRMDVGTSAYGRPENGDDAVTTVSTALDAYGVPQELLSDNGAAFNLSRQGAVTQLQRVLADRGCLAITGQFRSPTTQGKDERSHQTLQRFLTAHKPVTLDAVQDLLVDYRKHYNHHRPHQSLPGSMRPGQAWQAAEHRPSDGTPIPHTDLVATALAYKAKNTRTAATAELVGQDRQHTVRGHLRPLPDQVVVTKANPQIYLQGKIIKVPTHLVGTYAPVLTDTEYMLFDTRDGGESIGFPMPLDVAEVTGRMILLWQVRGARIRDPKPSWLDKQRTYAAKHYASHDGRTESGSVNEVMNEDLSEKS